mgnify:CR=1 FL=1
MLSSEEESRVLDMREIRNERTIFMFTITDFTDTIGVKIFVQNAEVPELKDAIKKRRVH